MRGVGPNCFRITKSETKSKRRPKPRRRQKKSLNLSGQKNHATSRDEKNHATSWYKKNLTTSWGKKCPKNSILVTNKIQEIGTGHLGLVFFNGHFYQLFAIKPAIFKFWINFQGSNQNYKIEGCRWDSRQQPFNFLLVILQQNFFLRLSQ